MPKKAPSLTIFICLMLLAVIACQISIDSGNPTSPPAATDTLSPEPIATQEATLTTQPTPTSESSQIEIPAGWSTYRNSEYGFEISYPSDYQALDDAENLYGWPNGIVLLYNGGQSYDIAIQVWDSQAEPLANYPNAGENLWIFPVGDKFISVFDVTMEPENAAVIATFKLIP